MKWNVKTNAAFQKEWDDHKDDYSTEDYDTLRSPFEIYLPFWKCRQNIVVEKDLELDRFSKILLSLISNRISSHSEICQFLGIDEDNFCTMQLAFLKNHNLIEQVDSNYEIKPEGLAFLEDRSKPKTMETEEFDYMSKERIDFLRNDMTSDFFDPSRPIDDNRNSEGKNSNFSGYKILETHKIQNEIKDKIYIKHGSNPTYRKIADKRTDFAEFFKAMNPGKFFYDFADSEFDSHRRNICFLGFWYEKKENPSDRKIEIRQFEKSVEEFKELELERELSNKVTDYVIKNEIIVGESDLPKEVQTETEPKDVQIEAEQKETQKEMSSERLSIIEWIKTHAFSPPSDALRALVGKKLDGIPDKTVEPKKHCIKDKFVEAAKQSKRDADGYILMNEFSLTLKNMNVEWDASGFKNFLKNNSDVIEFKPGTPAYAQAIRVKGVLGSNSIDSPKKTEISKPTEVNKPIEANPAEINTLEKILTDADKIYIDTCTLMGAPWEKFFEKANPILKQHKKKVIILTAVAAELKRNAKSTDSEKRCRAGNALKALIANETHITGEEDDEERIADQVFKITFEKYRHKQKMLLISKDYNLSKEILNLNNSEAVLGKKCMVYKIDKDGNLMQFQY